MIQSKMTWSLYMTKINVQNISEILIDFLALKNELLWVFCRKYIALYKGTQLYLIVALKWAKRYNNASLCNCSNNVD